MKKMFFKTRIFILIHQNKNLVFSGFATRILCALKGFKFVYFHPPEQLISNIELNPTEFQSRHFSELKKRRNQIKGSIHWLSPLFSWITRNNDRPFFTKERGSFVFLPHRPCLPQDVRQEFLFWLRST